jgi:glyoxylase-like metal-dependent hydrolase (beta-lactamase superfamily II)
MTLTEEGWSPTFPNAKYFVSNKDWKLFSRLLNTKSFKYIKEQVSPLIELGLLNRFEGEISLTDEIRTLQTPGHTPGHNSLLISSNNEKAIITGDAIHIPIQFNHPDWSPSIDRNKSLSVKSRQLIIDYIEKEHALIAAGHFASPGFGNIIKVNSKKTYIPVSS